MQDMNQYGDIMTVRSDSSMNEIMKNFSSDYVISIMYREIDNFKNLPMDISRPINNIVPVIEQEFHRLSEMYPYDKENLTTTRSEIYYNIIQTIGNQYKLIISFPEEYDLYKIALALYQFFICDLNNNIINFLTSFINNNIDSLFQMLGGKKKDNKQPTTYTYKNPNTMDVLSNMSGVMSYVSEMDITIHQFVQSNPTIYNIIKDYIDESDSFMREFVCPKLLDYQFSPILIASIKQNVHNSQLAFQPTIESYL